MNAAVARWVDQAHDARERHPEWWVAVVAAGAWAALLAAEGGDGAARRSPGGGGHDHGAAVAALGPWALMVMAMMVPLVLPTLRRVARASLWRRRHWAMAVFLAGYVAVWSAAGLVVLELTHVAAGVVGPAAATAAAVAFAVAWSRHAVSRRAVARCGAAMPLAPRGWRADRDAAGFGARVGWSCVVSCWAAMAAVAAFGHHGAAMAAALALQLHGRLRT